VLQRKHYVEKNNDKKKAGVFLNF